MRALQYFGLGGILSSIMVWAVSGKLSATGRVYLVLTLGLFVLGTLSQIEKNK